MALVNVTLTGVLAQIFSDLFPLEESNEQLDQEEGRKRAAEEQVEAEGGMATSFASQENQGMRQALREIADRKTRVRVTRNQER